jgi:hypothetical protein
MSIGSHDSRIYSLIDYNLRDKSRYYKILQIPNSSTKRVIKAFGELFVPLKTHLEIHRKSFLEKLIIWIIFQQFLTTIQANSTTQFVMFKTDFFVT